MKSRPTTLTQGHLQKLKFRGPFGEPDLSPWQPL